MFQLDVFKSTGGLVPLLFFIPMALTILAIGLTIVFVVKYLKNRQIMMIFLAILFIFYLGYNFSQVAMNASNSLESVKSYFLWASVLNLMTIYMLIIIFEMFEKNTFFTLRQTIMTALAFVIIGGILSDPSLSSVQVAGRYYVDFERFSAISISSLIFYVVSSVWIISSLVRGYKSARSRKQKTMIAWLARGLLLAGLLPSIQYMFTPSPEVQVDTRAAFSLQFTLFRAIVQSAGMIIIGVAFLRVSTYPWLLQRQRTHLLTVYSHTGVCLFSKAFDEEITEDDMLLLSGGFSAVTNLFQEATKATGKVDRKSVV